MVVMLAKWPGKCRRCGKPIVVGASIDWVKGVKGAVHATPEDCERAPAEAPPLRGPQPEDPYDRLRAVHLLLSHPWKSATSKRYAALPHQYSLRRYWVESDFLWVAAHIQATGYEQHFIGRIWIYYNADSGGVTYQHWNCDGPVEQSPLINRAVCRPASAPSKVAT